MSQKFEKLKSLLKELFQLDQPDLDFGLYRIMHAKAAEVTGFLERDLLPQVKQEFSQYKSADKAELEAQLAKAIESARGLGVDPETTQKVKDLRAILATGAVDIAKLEGEVYEHLLSFFGRYYSDGDFLSKRRYSRDGRYAIPYDGEEVKLYWANHDQYYIKTSEYLRDYAFRLKPDDDAKPMRVHFRLVDAAEEEHGNIKAVNGKDRVFILHAAKPLSLTDDGQQQELFVDFEYRPATLNDWPAEDRKAKSKPPAQKELTASAESGILSAAAIYSDRGPWAIELAKPHVKADGERADYTRLRAHLNRYVARNTFDYFIHKDLGGFLRRELDFFIKNEVMHLDDVENQTAPRVEQYLSQIKVIRRIAGKIIAFLAQLEDFQKTLWLKKKFVVETRYCVALKEVPKEFYADIARNTGQLEEWKELYGLEPTSGKTSPDSGLFGDDTAPIALSQRLRVPPSCMIDTRHFPADVSARLLETLGDLDEKIDGALFQSENFQALNLMQARYRENVKCVYMDPPYNTGNDGFSYKDSYQHSSWLAMMESRLLALPRLLSENSVVLSSIDDIETSSLRMLLSMIFGGSNFIGNMVWKGATDNNPTRIAVEHEYVTCFTGSSDSSEGEWSTADNEIKQLMLDTYELIRRKNDSLEEIQSQFEQFASENREKLGDLYRYRRIDVNGPYAARRNMENPGKPGYTYDIIHPVLKKPCDKPYWGWRFPETTMKEFLANDRIIFGKTDKKVPELKVYLKDVKFPLRSVFSLDARKGSNDLDRLFGSREVFKNPKPTDLLTRLLPFMTSALSTVLDFFAGSGTTGHAVINLGREDGGRRKFILVEMADYFDTVLLPRLKKVSFTPDWKDGKPKRAATGEEIERGPRVFKIVRLESYEDTLNNLEVKRTASQQNLLDLPDAQGPDKLREQYVLQYLLKVETQGSPSLLNVAAFTDPTAYRLVVKRPGSDESREVCVDLLETFNWLLGLTVNNITAWKGYAAKFIRDEEKRLHIALRRGSKVAKEFAEDVAGPFWFREVKGATPDGRKTLVIWRKLTGKPEEDNLALDEWFSKQGYSSKDSEFDLIYVNGGNNLENLKAPDDTWKVRLIEDDFRTRPL
jgi:adenine-specific DNA-methyltransferase